MKFLLYLIEFSFIVLVVLFQIVFEMNQSRNFLSNVFGGGVLRRTPASTAVTPSSVERVTG